MFNDEQMIAIGKVRVRLENYRNKIQPYPSLPEPTEEELPYKVRGLTYKERNEFNQLKANFLFLDKKINQHLDKKKKHTNYIYSSIKGETAQPKPISNPKEVVSGDPATSPQHPVTPQQPQQI